MPPPADSRHLQANERTFLAWVRTGLALIAFGFLIDRLALWLESEHRAAEEQVAAFVIGTSAIALGALCEIIGVIRFVAGRRALLAGRVPVHGVVGPVLLAVLVTVLALVLLVYLLRTSGG